MNAFVAAGYEGKSKQQKNDPHETSVYCREPVQDAGSAGSTQMNARFLEKRGWATLRAALLFPRPVLRERAG
jgi:hypothetical protein